MESFSVAPAATLTNVLIVDDDPLFRSLTRAWVEDDPRLAVAGEAANGADAVALLAAGDVDTLLIDLEMPVLDGATAAMRARALRPDLHIVMLTGTQPAAAREAELRAAVDVLLFKTELSATQFGDALVQAPVLQPRLQLVPAGPPLATAPPDDVLEASAQQEEEQQQEQQEEQELADEDPAREGEDQDDHEKQYEHFEVSFRGFRADFPTQAETNLTSFRWTVWPLRVSVFSLLPLLLLVHPGFGGAAFLAVIAATAAFVPFERAVERRFYPALPHAPLLTPGTRRLHLVEPLPVSPETDEGNHHAA